MKDYLKKEIRFHIYARLAGIYQTMGKRSCLRVEGNSMCPTIRHGDTVVVEFMPVTLEVGDVVVFVDRRKGKLVTHRLVSLPGDMDMLITKGDNNRYPDAPLFRKDVIGKIVATDKNTAPMLSVVLYMYEQAKVPWRSLLVSLRRNHFIKIKRAEGAKC